MVGCSLAADPTLLPHLDDYRRLVRVRALWRRGARLGRRDADFDVREYRPQTPALVQEAVAVARLRHDLPIYRIDGEYLTRLEAMPGGAEEKAAEIEAALEYEIRVRGGDKDPVARSLAERLERVRRGKEGGRRRHAVAARGSGRRVGRGEGGPRGAWSIRPRPGASSA